MDLDQQEAFLQTFEQAGPTKVRKTISSDKWPSEVQDLAHWWLSTKEEEERRKEALQREQIEIARSARDAAATAHGLSQDALDVARDANVSARAAFAAADKSARQAMISSVIAAIALAVATAAIIAAAWPK